MTASWGSLKGVDCPIDDVLDALSADVPAMELRHGIGVHPPPPGSSKAWFGTPAGDTHETDNFGLVWAPGQADTAQAQAVGDALESAWQELIVADDWAQPPLSEAYLIWVVLDPYLGTTGRTELYSSSDAPEGYTVVSIDPNLTGEALELAAAHELMHAVQFRLRDPSDTDLEAWYWEATAVWAADRVVGGSAWTDEAQAYLDAPGERYDSRLDDHDRGMVLLNLWLEQDGGSVQAVWDEGRISPGDDWAEILGRATDQESRVLFARFSAAMGNGDLDGASLLGPIALDNELLSGVSGFVPLYGSHHFEYLGTEPMRAELSDPSSTSDTWLASPQGVGTSVEVQPGDVLASVGLSDDGAIYQIFLSPLDPGPGTETPPHWGVTRPSEETVIGEGCECGHTSGAGWWAWILLIPGIARRR